MSQRRSTAHMVPLARGVRGAHEEPGSSRWRALLFPLVLQWGSYVGLALVAAFGGCAEPTDHLPLRQAHAGVRDALSRRDAAALFDASPREFQAELDSLAERLVAAESLLDERFPPAEARALWKQLALGLLDGGPTGRGVFASLVTFPDWKWGEDTASGMLIERLDVSGVRAVVHTAAKETFDYVQDSDGTWRSVLAPRAWQAWTDRSTLLANLAQVQSNALRMEEQTHTLRDPRTAYGALNRLRAAVVDRRADEVYTLLDQASRDALDRMARGQQPVAEGEPTPSAEGEQAEPAWQTAARQASHGRDLTALLLPLGEWSAELPGSESDRVAEIRREPDGSRVSVLADGRALRWIREDQEVWRTTALHDWLAARGAPVLPHDAAGAP